MSYRDYDRNYRRPAGVSRYTGNRRRVNRRLRNRIIIIASALVALALVIVLITSAFSCVCSSGAKGSKIDTATKSTKPKTESVKKATVKKEISFREPSIEYDESTGTGTAVSDNLYVWNQMAFELFNVKPSQAKSYAEVINSAQKSLGGKIKVHSMIVPNQTEMALPGQVKSQAGLKTVSQADYIKKVYDTLSSDISFINCYNHLSKYNSEYIYFDSDPNWTGLGAYYGYKAFASATKQKAVKLTSLNEDMIEGFNGSYSSMTEETLNTDSVHFWDFPYSVKSEITRESGETETVDGCFNKYAEGSDSYSVFLNGDNPLEVIRSGYSKAKNGKIAVVHDSLGNAFIPYLTYNYKEIYSVDYRTYKSNLKKLCRDNGITEVLFINGAVNSADASQQKAIKSIIG